MPTQEIKVVLKEALDRIKNLMEQEKWMEAHRACLEILRFDPDNLKIIRLSHKIEKIVKGLNVKSIKKDLESLEPLWKEKRYEELLENLKQLEPYIKEYPPLKDIILKAQDGYRKKVVEKQEEYFQQEKKRIESLVSEKKFQDALRSAEKLRLLQLHEKELRNTISSVKKLSINHEIEQNKPLLDSEKHEEILLFFQHLKSIDSHSEKVNRLMNEAKKRYEQFKIDQKKDFIYEGLEKIRTLYQLKKFESAAEGAREILDIDPKNQKAKSFFEKASKRAKRRGENELINQMRSSYRKMKADKKQGQKEDYINI